MPLAPSQNGSALIEGFLGQGDGGGRTGAAGRRACALAAAAYSAAREARNVLREVFMLPQGHRRMKVLLKSYTFCQQ
jgi:hypothetical protein